ncbi:unnamed protein product [Choristocarpus tenellus]
MPPGLALLLLFWSGIWTVGGQNVDTLTIANDQEGVVPFFIYDKETYPQIQPLTMVRSVEELQTCEMWTGTSINVGYWDITFSWYNALLNHPWRTTSPEGAEVFVVLFDLEQSNNAGICGEETHQDRVEEAVHVLRSSPWYRRKYGRDHMWPVGWYLIDEEYPEKQRIPAFPYSLRDTMRNMTVSHYIDWHMNSQDVSYWKGGGRPLDEPDYWRQPWWRTKTHFRCSVTTPVVVGPYVYKEDLSFEEWQARDTLVFFRGKFDKFGCSKADGAQVSRDKTEELWNAVPNISVHKRHAKGDPMNYSREIHNSRFCLVMNCDDPQTSRFVDSMAAGCMPLIIDNGFRLVAAPFNEILNYDTFTISVPSEMWNQDPTGAIHFIYTYPEVKLRRMYEALINARKHLLWNHPESTVATNALLEVKRDCLSPGAPVDYPPP